VQMHISPLDERVVKVTLNGRLDTQGVDSIETGFVAALVPTAKHVVIDLSQVSFVASMGIRLLVSTAQKLKQEHAILAIYGAPALVRQVFSAVSLHKILPICSTEAEAVAAVSAPSA